MLNSSDEIAMSFMNAAPGPRPVKPTLCRYFANNGYCFYGEQCQFSHAKTSSRTPGKHTLTFVLVDFDDTV